MASKKRKHVPGYIRFPIAGLSGMGASLVTQPMDLVKFRMQLSGEGGAAADHKTFAHAFGNIVKKKGIRGLYRGLSANLLHQGVYATTRVGSYQTMVDQLKQSDLDSLTYEILAAATGGCIAGILATPVEVPFVRMASDGRLAISERRNYVHVFDALRRIYKEEGAKSLMTGMKPTVLRAIVGNVSQLVTYNQTKDFLLKNEYMENDIKCHLLSSIVAGFVFSLLTCPIDVIKTRIQFMDKTGETRLYSGIVDAMTKTVRKEGVLALWKGFIPWYSRCAPHTILMFLFFENLTFLYRKYLSEEQGADY